MTFVIDSPHLQNNVKIFLLFKQSINSCKINIDKIMRKDGLEGKFHVKLII